VSGKHEDENCSLPYDDPEMVELMVEFLYHMDYNVDVMEISPLAKAENDIPETSKLLDDNCITVGRSPSKEKQKRG
jgi:hypothetical protein